MLGMVFLGCGHSTKANTYDNRTQFRPPHTTSSVLRSWRELVILSRSPVSDVWKYCGSRQGRTFLGRPVLGVWDRVGSFPSSSNN